MIDSESVMSSPSPVELELVGSHFDVAYYTSEYPDLDGESSAMLKHFCTMGWREGRNPNAFFDTVSYLLEYPDVAREGINPYFHYLCYGSREKRQARSAVSPSIRSLLLFDNVVTDWVARVRAYVDPEYYTAKLGDALTPGMDLVAHFAYRGWREGFAPAPGIDLCTLGELYPQAMALLVNPVLVHAEELRGAYVPVPIEAVIPKTFSHESVHPQAASSSEVSATDFSTDDDAAKMALVRLAFSTEYYLAQNSDVAAVGIDPVAHYFHTGWREGRNPTKDFDTTYYLQANEDVALAGVNPYWHFLVSGRREGRSGQRPGGYRRKIIDQAREPARRTEGYVVSKEKPIAADKLLRRLTSGVAGRRGLVVSLSHDCYVKVIGGTQIFIADEQRRFGEHRWLYLHLSPQVPRLALAQRDPKFMVQVVIDGERVGITELPALVKALRKFKRLAGIPKILAMHSFLGFNAADIGDLHGALCPQRSIFWLHDYSSLCEGFNLLRNDVEFCDAPPLDSMACRVCIYGGGREAYLAALRSLFAQCKFEVAAPSAFALNLWQRASDLPHDAAFAHPHWALGEASVADYCGAQDLNQISVAFVGFPSPSKGWPVFCDMAEQLAADSRYTFYHFAAAGTATLPDATFVPTEVTANDRNATTGLLHKHRIDFVAMLSPWPETFSFVAHEAVAAGALIVCLADSGNVAALVRATGRGVVLEDAAAVLAFFASGDAVGFVEGHGPRTWYSMLDVGTTAKIDGILGSGAQA
jgi:hypothetical protein